MEGIVMGRSRNRKKRRLGRIHKQALNHTPILMCYQKYYRQRVDIWCGLEKWKDAVYDKCVSLLTEQDKFEMEIVITEKDDDVQIEEPNYTNEGFLRRKRMEIELMKNFDDSGIKGKHYHSKKATQIRKERIKQYIHWYERLWFYDGAVKE